MDIRITIQKRSQTGWLTHFLVLMPYCLSALTDFLGIPPAVRYVPDVLCLVLVVYLLRFHYLLDFRKVGPLLIWTLLFLLYTLVVYLFRWQSGLYYLWGVRNLFRFYGAFFALSLFAGDGESDLDMIEKLFWLNFGIALVQYFLLGLRNDYLGGLFGNRKGCNGYTNLLLLVVTAKSVVYCLNREESLPRCLRKCAAALYLAALTELKVFYGEFLLIVGLGLVYSRFSLRKLGLIFFAGVGAGVGVWLLLRLYPEFRELLSVDAIWNMLSGEGGYTSRGDINRLSAISYVNEHFFSHWTDKLFGLGLGNCDTSAFAFLNTPFYQQHSWTHYAWFLLAQLYLETGYVGLFFYFGFFGLYYVRTGVLEKSGGANRLHCQMGRILAVCCCAVAVYNASLRGDAGYLAWFALALPYMKTQEENGRE